MRITSSWTEVLDMAEKMILYIFSRLPRQCKREMEVIQKAYPEAGNFKLPAAADKVPRITFAEGVKMLREAGYEASETEDIRYVLLPFPLTFSPTSPIHPSTHPSKTTPAHLLQAFS